MIRDGFVKKKNNTIGEGEEVMAGYDLAEGRYENRTLSDDEMWSALVTCSHLVQRIPVVISLVF